MRPFRIVRVTFTPGIWVTGTAGRCARAASRNPLALDDGWRIFTGSAVVASRKGGFAEPSN